MINQDSVQEISKLNIPLERDLFLRNLVRELSGVLEDVVGLEQAQGFISIVGQQIGESINKEYQKALKVSHLNREQLIQVLVDMKKRIQGDFYIISQDDDKIVLGNRSCPFAEKVKDRTSLCMMTSNVFGIITAENLGYAKVVLGETIAKGDNCCRVTVYLTPDDESDREEGHEYFHS